MIEVEAKVKLNNVEEARRKLKKIVRLIKKEKKSDDYYSLAHSKKYPKKSLRIRKRENHYEINFKQKLSYIKGVHAKIESEFNVSDIKNFLKLIKDFGFKKWLTKYKTSEIYRIKNNFNVELNHVKSLGWFLEIEYLVKNENQIPKARKEILEIMKKLNISPNQIRKEGYTKMLWDKLH